MDHPNAAGHTRAFMPIALTLAALIALLFVASQAQASHKKYCKRTAQLQRASCDKAIGEEDFVAKAVCLNFEDSDERHECDAERREEKAEAGQGRPKRKPMRIRSAMVNRRSRW